MLGCEKFSNIGLRDFLNCWAAKVFDCWAVIEFSLRLSCFWPIALTSNPQIDDQTSPRYSSCKATAVISKKRKKKLCILIRLMLGVEEIG